MRSTKEGRGFTGAAELAQHAARAMEYLKQVHTACAAGDKTKAQRALRQALSELETARTGLRIGHE
jgi:ribosomal protein S20